MQIAKLTSGLLTLMVATACSTAGQLNLPSNAAPMITTKTPAQTNPTATAKTETKRTTATVNSVTKSTLSFAVDPEVEVITVAPSTPAEEETILPNEKKGTLHILTYNVWGLPGFLGTDRKERFARLGPTLAPYDVVTLQETFSDDIKVLKKNSAFPYHHRHNNGGLLRIGSGLYTLSKYPIIKTGFKAFNNCTVADCMARKGVLFSRIQHPTLGPIDVYNTHYQAEGNPVAEKIRVTVDNRVMQEFIHENHSDNPTVLTGDYNFTPDRPEYNDIMRRLPLIDVFRTLHPADPGYTSDGINNENKDSKHQSRLDYIFVRKSDQYKVDLLASTLTHNQKVDNYMLSDHFGVQAKLKFHVPVTDSAE